MRPFCASYRFSNNLKTEFWNIMYVADGYFYLQVRRVRKTLRRNKMAHVRVESVNNIQG